MLVLRSLPSHDNLHLRKALFEAPNNPSQDAHRAAGRMDIARTQHCTHQLSALSVKDQQGVIHLLIIVAVKEGELLLAMRGIVRGVNIQDDDGWCCTQGPHILFLNLTDKCPQPPHLYRILQPRQRGV